MRIENVNKVKGSAVDSEGVRYPLDCIKKKIREEHFVFLKKIKQLPTDDLTDQEQKAVDAFKKALKR